MRNLTKVAHLVVLGAVAGACATDTATSITTPADPKAAVLSVRYEGGFAPIETILHRLPRFTLLADGTLIHEGPQIMIYPGPLLPNLQTSLLDEETMDLVFEYVAGIGLPAIETERNDEATVVIADAPDEVVTYFDQNGEHVFSVYALTIYEQFTDARVLQLRDLVRLLEEASFSGSVGGAYQAENLQVIAGVAQFPPEAGVANRQPWPLPVSFGELDVLFDPWRCATYEADQAQELFSVFGQANQATTWELDGVEYQLLPRPLLPGERPCASLPG